MRCAAIEVGLGFETDLALPTPFGAVRAALASPDSLMVGSRELGISVPIEVLDPSKRLGALVTERRLTVRSERDADMTAMLTDVMSQFRRATSFLRGIPVDDIQVISTWIAPFRTNWTGLLQSYAQAFYMPSTLPPEATDASLIFEVDHDTGKDTYQSGPMWKQQLVSQYLTLWTEDSMTLPELLLFFIHRAAIRGDGKANVTTRLRATIGSALARASSFAEYHHAQFNRGGT